MKHNFQKIYKEFIKRYHIFGIESDYHNLHHVHGPDNPNWLHGQTIYEIYVRAFSEEGTFEAVRKRLPEIKSLGVGVIWFMPIFPIGKVERKGKLGCPYSVQDYYRVNPEYGSSDEFMNLVKDIHNLEMKVLIDLVANHVAHDYEGFKSQPELALRNEDGLSTRKIAEWSDVVDFDHNNILIWEHLLDIMRFWIEKFNIDGYRCDVAGLLPSEFWEWVVPQIRSIKLDVFMLAEWENPFLHKEAFHSTYDWTLYRMMLDVMSGKAPASDLADWIETKMNVYPTNSLFLRFIENHYKERAAKLFNEEQLTVLLVFIFSIDGLPLIYNGQEIGASHYPSLFKKDTIDWQNTNDRLIMAYKILIELRKKYTALSNKNYLFAEHNQKNSLLIFKKEEDNTLLIMINFSDKAIKISELKDIKIDSKMNVLFNTHENCNAKQLAAYQGVILAAE